MIAYRKRCRNATDHMVANVLIYYLFRYFAANLPHICLLIYIRVTFSLKKKIESLKHTTQTVICQQFKVPFESQ